MNREVLAASTRLRAKSLFARVVEQPPSERAAFLDRECAGDPLLHEFVSRLLLADQEAGEYLEAPGGLLHAAFLGDQPGDPIGPFRLVEMLGEGGFGTVWRAEQAAPLRRVVALKLIKVGMDTRRVIERFEAERQALALMDHPNIAHVLEAGATPQGRPYFVMELVEGQPITAYCAARELAIAEKLRLFVPVCLAIEHAHQKGVVHRDLKPGNVLVTEFDGKPVPKVIDFGIAKATRARLTERTLNTESGLLIGTPGYMSPEQTELQGVDVDTRSDVYALGVLLFEVLTGELPLDLAGSYVEVVRVIQQTPPKRPSALDKRLRGDLDVILLKAIEKEREARYQSAGELAADLARTLRGEPITARPATATYQLRKFARRNRMLVGAAGSLLAVIVVALAVSIYLAVSAEQSRRAMLRITEVQRRVLGNIDVQAFGGEIVDALRHALPGDVSGAAIDQLNAADLARGLVDRVWLKPSEAAFDKEFGDEPGILAELLASLGDTYRQLGMQAAGIPQQRRAYEMLERHYGPNHERTISALANLAVLIGESGDAAAAEPYYRLAAERAEIVDGPDNERTLICWSNVAWVLEKLGKTDEANTLALQLADRAPRALGAAHKYSVVATANGARALERMHRLSEAEAMQRRALQGALDLWPTGSEPFVLQTNLASMVAAQGRVDEAVGILQQALATGTTILGAEHPELARITKMLGHVLSREKRYAEALPWFEQALRSFQDRVGLDHPDTLLAEAAVAQCVGRLGRRQEAKGSLTEILRRAAEKLGSEHSSCKRIERYLQELTAADGK